MIHRLYDRIINLTLYYHEEVEGEPIPHTVYSPKQTIAYTKSTRKALKQSMIHIDSTESGRKPNITIKYSRVPENFCYNCTITISSLYIQANFINVDRIEVELGYTDDVCEKLQCTVFAAYQPSPGPDGITVFECLVAKGQGAFERAYHLRIFTTSKKYTIQDVFDVIVDMLDLDDDSRLVCPEEFKQLVFTEKDIMGEPFNTGYSLLKWFQSKVNDIGNNLTYKVDKQGVVIQDERVTFTSIFFNNKWFLIGLRLGQKGGVQIQALKDKLGDKDDVLVLDKVSNVDWNAGTLTVVAPYVPSLIPGKLFKITPRYYQGGKGLPNEVARVEGQKDPFDMYYVLTEDVQFATTGDTNQMTIKAVPFVHSPAGSALTMKYEQTDLSKLLNTAKLQVTRSTDITLGTEDLEKAVTNGEVRKVHLGLGADDRLSVYTIKSGDDLSHIAKEMYSDCPLISKEAEWCRVEGYLAWWPLILAATYDMYTGGDKEFELNPENPDAIEKAHKLLLPAADWNKMYTVYKSRCLNIWDTYYTYYKAKNKFLDLADGCKQCAEIFRAGGPK